MARDGRDRVEEAQPEVPEQGPEGLEFPYAPGEADLATTGEAGERNAAYNAAMRDYAPPFVRPTARGNYMFSAQDLMRYGMSDAEIIKLQREGAAAGNGGLSEYDEDVEAERLAQKRGQLDRLAVIDGGSAVRTQHSYMEAYFAGQVENGAGQRCKRHPYVSPTDEIVGVNGYVFQIPRYKRVMLPTEVLEILAEAATARQQYDVLSAIYTARQFRPLTPTEAMGGTDPDTFINQVRANHHVRPDLIPR